jgi:hypothetical protein
MIFNVVLYIFEIRRIKMLIAFYFRPNIYT